MPARVAYDVHGRDVVERLAGVGMSQPMGREAGTLARLPDALVICLLAGTASAPAPCAGRLRAARVTCARRTKPGPDLADQRPGRW